MPKAERKKIPGERPARSPATKTAVAGTRRAAVARRAVPHMSVLRQFRELFRISQQHFQRIEATCGLSGAQLWALSEVGKRPGLMVSEVAQALSIHLSTASNLLDKLEAKRLIRRERAAADQRVVQIHLTRSGQKVMREAPQPAEGVIPSALAKLPDEALRRLQRDLQQVLNLAGIRNPKAALRPLAEP